MTIILKGHISPETAYVVDDYPYGFRLRCTIRYWLDCHPKRGVRLSSQTSNPKRGGMWNKPKTSTYCLFGGCMYLDDNKHIQWSGLTEYTNGAGAAQWRDTYGEGCPEALQGRMNQWVTAKIAYDASRLARSRVA